MEGYKINILLYTSCLEVYWIIINLCFIGFVLIVFKLLRATEFCYVFSFVPLFYRTTGILEQDFQ